jgi:hypothetical protein
MEKANNKDCPVKEEFKSKEWILAEGVPLPHLEKHLNENIPEKYPDYAVFDIIQQTVIPPKNAIAVAGPPQPVAMGFPLLKKKHINPLINSSILPLVMEDTNGKVESTLVVSSISGGKNYENDMPKELTLVRRICVEDKTYYMKYVQLKEETT